MNKSIFRIWFSLCITVLGAVDLCAQEQKADEYQVKAEFLYNFINFIEWPADASINSSPAINVCIVGDDPFDTALDSIRNTTVKSKRMSLRFYRPYDKPKGCHLIFIPESESKRAAHILKLAGEGSVLTVADTEEMVRQGAVIGFFIAQKKVRIAINTEAARRAGLRISAKLLKVGKIVKGPEEQGEAR